MTSCISFPMASFELISIIICVLMCFAMSPIDALDDFNQNYYPLWGQNHITFLNHSTEVQLFLDKSSGIICITFFIPHLRNFIEMLLWSLQTFTYDFYQMVNDAGAGFHSKLQYKSGLFTIRMKISNNKTDGVITSFYVCY